MMKKRTKRFDDGGMASSGPQSAFYQPRNPAGTDTGVGGVAAAPLPGPLDLGQHQPQEQPMQQMRRGGKVKTKTYAAGGAVKKSRGDGCAQRGKTKGTMR